MADTTFKYAAQTDLKNYFNSFAEYDQKTQIFNWTKWADVTEGASDTDDLDVYYSYNTGPATQLYFDGIETRKIAQPVIAVGLVNDATFLDSDVSFTIDAGHGLEAGDFIKVNNEYMYVTGIETNLIIVTRGAFNTTPSGHANDVSVYLIINLDLISTANVIATNIAPLAYSYDDELDLVILLVDGSATGGSDPNDHIIEGGTDFTTFADQQLVNASLELNNLLDARFNTPIQKSTQIKIGAASELSPEYDPIIIKCTCYLAAANMIRSKEVMSEEGQYYMDLVTNDEGTGLVDRLNSGQVKLSFEIDNKDSSGSVREITKTGSMFLVETSGIFIGGSNGYDLLRITCTTEGAYGVARVRVEYFGDRQLFGLEARGQYITGSLDRLLGLSGLEVRFQGASMSVGDQWEIECYHDLTLRTNDGQRNINLYRGNYIGKRY